MPGRLRSFVLAVTMGTSFALVGCTVPATPTTPPTPAASTGCPEGTTLTEGFCLADGALAQDLAATVRSIFDERDIGAVIAGVYQDGAPIMTGALGESMTGVPATVDMHHRTGNLGWPMLSTVVLQQVEAGTLALDDTISTWLPDLPAPSRSPSRCS